MQLVEFKENAWKYTEIEKMEIVTIGLGGVVKNVAKNFHISQPTFRRWRQKYFSIAVKIFGKNKAKKEALKNAESNEIETTSKEKLLSMLPDDLIHKVKYSGEYRKYCIEAVHNRQYFSAKQACKSVGMSSKTYYGKKDCEWGDRRKDYPGLIALDLVLDNRKIDKDSLALKLDRASLKVSAKEAGFLRWQAPSYIKLHKLRQITAVYQFLNADDAWCLDFQHLYDSEGRVLYHLKVIDDRSRMDIASVLLERATTKGVIEVLEEAFNKTVRLPSVIKADRGTQFKVVFNDFLKQRRITHLKNYPNFPQFIRKIEKRFQEVGIFLLKNTSSQLGIRELITLESNVHNFVRPHESLDCLTPSDVYWKGKDPPFKHPDAKTEYVINWYPNLDTNTQVIISR